MMLILRLVGAFWPTTEAATATDCARLGREARLISQKNVSNKPLFTLPQKIAGCSTDGTPAPELSSLPTELGRAPSLSALSGP